MPLFTDSVNSLHNLFGDDVSYRQGELAAVTVKAVYRNPTEEQFVGASGVITEVTMFEVALDVIAKPAKGDQITTADGSVYEVQTDPTLDDARTTWLLDVKRTYRP